MMQSVPQVSVIIPLYNHELYVEEAVRSVLEQSCTNLELIVINDGSTDGSEAVVKRINDGRIRYYSQENRGAHEALNRGIDRARGAYVAVLNSDDIYHPRRIEEALKILEYDHEVAGVFTYIELIDAKGELLGIKRGAEDNWTGQSAESSFREEHDTVLDLLAGNFLHTTSNLICRREVFDRIGLFANLRYTHDYEFYLRLCAQYRVAMIRTPLLKYRFHEANTLAGDSAASRFETGMVLADFLLTYDLRKILGEGSGQLYRLTKLYNSIRTYDTDRIIMLLLLLGLKGDVRARFWELFADGCGNPFRGACIDSLAHTHDLCAVKETLRWQQAQTETWWAKAQEWKAALEQREAVIAELEVRDRKAQEWKAALEQREAVIAELEVRDRKAQEWKAALEQREAVIAELEVRDREQNALIEELQVKETRLNRILASPQWRWLQRLNKVRNAVRHIGGSV